MNRLPRNLRSLPDLLKTIKESGPTFQLAKRAFTHNDITKKDASTVFQLVRDNGQLSEDIYYYFLLCLAKDGDVEGMQEGFKMANSDGIERTQRWDTLSAISHASRNQLKETIAAFNKLIDENRTIRADDIIFCMKKLGTTREALNELEILVEKWLAHGGVLSNAYVPNTFIYLYYKVADFDAGARWLEKLKANNIPRDDYTFGFLLKNAAENLDYGKVQQLLAEMKQEGCQPTTATFNALIKAAADNNDEEKMMDYVNEMKKRGLEPTVITFNILLDAAAKQGEEEGVKHWFEQMKLGGLKPDVVAYNTVIGSAAARGDLLSAQHWIEAMREDGIQPTTTTFSALISATIKQDKLEDAQFWLDEMKKQGLNISILTLGPLIGAAGRAGKWDRVTELLTQLEKSGGCPDVLAYKSLARSALDQGELHRVTALMDDMETRLGVKPSNGFLLSLHNKTEMHPEKAAFMGELRRKYSLRGKNK